jgi:PAS domain S-box-containing protein
VWDVGTDTVYLTASWSGILGEQRRPVEARSRELSMLVHPGDLPQVQAAVEAVVRGPMDEYDIEHRVRTSSGAYRWIQCRGKVTQRDARGRAMCIAGTNSDITARRRAEEMLAARELQLRLVVDNVPAMIAEFDAEDRVRYCNGRWAALYRTTPEALAGQSVASVIGSGAYARFLEHSPRIRAGETVMYERVHLRPEQAERQLLVQIVPRMHRQRDYLGCYVMVEDVTERRRLEKMKEEFIGTVSHELRTPLKAIRASLERIASGTTPEELARLVDTARMSGERLVRLVNDILDYQRLRAGQAIPALQGIDLCAQVREAAAANESLAREAGVTLRVDAPDKRITVEADADRITQLVTNLVANALKHSAPSGKVEIAVSRRENFGRVRVRDYGPGVPGDFQPRLFTQFSQAQAADGKKRSGTGLGLAICKAIAEQMKGSVGFEPPADGAGAAFWFELPLH